MREIVCMCERERGQKTVRVRKSKKESVYVGECVWRKDRVTEIERV